MRTQRQDTAALMIDVQSRLFPHIHNYQQLELNTARLIQGLKVLDIPIIVSEQYAKGLGATLPSLQEVLIEHYKPLEKMTFSCCGNDDIDNALMETGKRNILVFGIEAHVCVLQTVIDLINASYKVIVVEDCISSRNENDKRVAVGRMQNEGAIITTYESILLELCRTSGTDEFKAISKIIK